MKTVLILGASLMQIPAIEAAKKMGWRVCTVDVNVHAVGIPKSDYFKKADLKNADEVISCAKQWDKEFGLDAVFTAGTDFSLTVAKVAKALSLPGIDVQTAMLATDKGLMREAFLKANVSIPKFFTIKSKSDLSDINKLDKKIIERVSYPVVIKPVDNMGARGIKRADSIKEVVENCLDAFEYSKSNTLIIEELIIGPEFSFDAIVEDGNATIIGFADRHIYFPPYFIEMGHTMPTAVCEDDQRILIAEFKKGIKALGIDNGVAKGDVMMRTLFDGKKEAVIGEIAARLSGGYMSGWTFPYASLVNASSLALRVAAGLPSLVKDYEYKQICAERAFLSIPGVVKSIQLPDSSLPIYEKSIKNVFIRIKKGDILNFPRNNVEKCGNIIVSNVSRERVSDIAQRWTSSVLVRLETDCKATYDYLVKGESKIEFPNAFNYGLDTVFKKNKNNEFILYRKLPKNYGREVSVQFYVENLQFEGVQYDWHGLTCDEVMTLLKNDGVVSDVANGAHWHIFPIDLFLTVLNRGSRQGLVWLADRFSSMDGDYDKKD